MDGRLRLLAQTAYQNKGSVGGTIQSFRGKTNLLDACGALHAVIDDWRLRNGRKRPAFSSLHAAFHFAGSVNQDGNEVPNIGLPLFDCSLVASS
jgi:hypothetical protein